MNDEENALINISSIKKAIAYCESLLESYDLNNTITDIDICHIIEILKNRE